MTFGIAVIGGLACPPTRVEVRTSADTPTRAGDFLICSLFRLSVQDFGKQENHMVNSILSSHADHTFTVSLEINSENRSLNSLMSVYSSDSI